MAWAIFSRDFNHDRRPAMAIAFSVKTGGPQQWPRDVVDAAVKSGAATEVKAPRKPKSAPKSA